uniref:Uncharacterized protein n=1 Tax=mine drainage metagenome TaxID=410659 RepID=E6QSC1_9ZZZZ
MGVGSVPHSDYHLASVYIHDANHRVSGYGSPNWSLMDSGIPLLRFIRSNISKFLNDFLLGVQ